MIKVVVYLSIIFLELSLFSSDFYYHKNKKVQIIKNDKYLSFNFKDTPNINSIKRILKPYINLYSDIKFGNKNRVFIKLKESNQNYKNTIRIALNDKYNKEYQAYYVKSIHNNIDSWPIASSDNIIIQFKSGFVESQVNDFMKKYSLKLERKSKLSDNLYIFKTESDYPIKIANKIYESGFVKISEVDFYVPYDKMFFPDDEFYDDQWHLKNAIGGVWAVDGWNYLENLIDLDSIDIKIAIIDDGIDLHHEDLNIIDYKNFTQESYDQGGRHGTACAGVAAARGDNSLGVVGGCPHCNILSAKMMNGDDNYGYTTSTPSSDAIKWATDNGADVISNSWGYKVYIPIPSYMEIAIDYAITRGRDRKGSVVVFAAGNDDRRIEDDELGANDDIITVAASTNIDERSYYSNYGPSIDVCAPSNGGSKGIVTCDAYSETGVDIRGYNLNGWNANNSPDLDRYGKYTKTFGGTSSATPLVSGLAALILAKNNNLNYLEVREIIRNGARKIGQLNQYDTNGHSNEFGYGKVDFEKSLIISSSGIVCTPTSGSEICDNNKDDDCDGKIDSNDSDCLMGNDCESTIETIKESGVYNGDTSLSIYSNNFIAPTLNDCNGQTNSNDIVYRVWIEKPSKATFEIKNANWDSVIYLKSSSCDNAESIACNDEANTSKLSKLTIDLDTGVYFLVVDGYGAFDQGAFSLDVNFELLPNSCENETCSNHGICKSELSSDFKECLCDEAYYPIGMECIPLTQKCDNIDCSNHGTCVIQNKEATCICDDNYRQEDFSCLIIDPCLPLNCSEREDCSEETSYQCVCKDGYYKGSNGFCILNSICEQECVENSTCTMNNETSIPECICNSGYKKDGDNCVLIKSSDSCNYGNQGSGAYLILLFISFLFLRRKSLKSHT